MARPKKQDNNEDGIILEKDFVLAISLYRNDIRKAISDAATSNGDAGTAYKEIKTICHIQPSAAKLGFRLMDKVEDAKRDDWFRGFVGIVNGMAGRTVLTFNDTDMVDDMERPKPQLVSVPNEDEDD